MQKKKKHTRTAQEVIRFHKKLKKSKPAQVTVNKETYSMFSGHGVREVASYIGKHPREADELTEYKKRIAIISDGSHVSGLGQVNPAQALSVVESTALLVGEIGKVQTTSLVVKNHSAKEFSKVIESIADTYAGVVLESVVAPKCFEIERRVYESVSIPVIHSNKDGTAIAILAGLINAHTLVHKNIRTSRIAVLGAGAVGIEVAKLLSKYRTGDVVVVDRDGILSTVRTNISGEKEELAQYTNFEGRTGGVLEAVVGADVLINTFGANVSLVECIRMMAQKPIVFNLAQQGHHITPNQAYQAGASIVATENSDYPNCIQSALVIPGIARAIVENNLQTFTSDMKIKVAETLAGLLKTPTEKKILPKVFDRRIAKSIVHALEK